MMAYVFSLMFGALHLGTAIDSLSMPMFRLFIQRDSRGIFTFILFWILYVVISSRICLANVRPATEMGG
jgi:hypothetical protein